MADVLIYTCNMGGYDTIRPQVEQDSDVDWLYLTDSGDVAPEPWSTIETQPVHDHPNLSAKVYKAQPPWHLADAFRTEWRIAIWVDANMEIHDRGFARAVQRYLHDGCAAWAHPRRDCVYDEADASLGAEGQDGRYELLPIREQMDAYRAEGYPEHNGLYATGTTVWTPEASRTFGAAWLAECERWGFQDQLSFPVAAWRLGIRPGVFGVHQMERKHSMIVKQRDRDAGVPYYVGNRWLRIWPHAIAPYR